MNTGNRKNLNRIDVVYPLSSQSKGPDDFELRYSLRSLDRQPWAGDLYVIGHLPAWLKNAHPIAMADQWPHNFKDKNIIKKMLRACGEPRISDPFVANSDDQYWLKPINPNEMRIPPREFPAQMDVDRFGRPYRSQWIRRQAETVEFLKKNKRSDIRFDGHVPYLIDKAEYLRTMNEIPWEMGEGFLIVVYHGWNFHTDNGFKIEDRDGVLVRIKEDLRPEQIEERTKKALFLNHNNRALSIGMREFLKNKFPDPSRWE